MLTVACAIVLVPAPLAAQDEPLVTEPLKVPDPPDPGDVPRLEMLVVDETGGALDTGGGETLFGLELEGEDECPGDSQHDQYRIDSYLVPVDVDPTQLLYADLGPEPGQFRDYETFQMPLYKVSTASFAAELTAQALEPGGPGPFPELPVFTFGVYQPTPGVDAYEGGLPSGTYRIGIACTLAGRVTNLWETTIELTQDPTDEPVGIAWRVTGPQPLDLESKPASAGGLVYGLVGVAVTMALVAFGLHRSSTRSEAREQSPPLEKVVT